MEKYLSIPPPAKQRPMCYPRIHPLLMEKGQIRAHHMGLRIHPFLVRYDAMEIPPVIMRKRLVIPMVSSVSLHAQPNSTKQQHTPPHEST
jgi:hypothetical protein